MRVGLTVFVLREPCMLSNQFHTFVLQFKELGHYMVLCIDAIQVSYFEQVTLFQCIFVLLEVRFKLFRVLCGGCW